MHIAQAEEGLKSICQHQNQDVKLTIHQSKNGRSMSYMYRGNCYRSLAQYEQSLADHTRAIELYPQNPQPRQNRALTYIELRELPSAQADLTRLLELDHQNAKGTTSWV